MSWFSFPRLLRPKTKDEEGFLSSILAGSTPTVLDNDHSDDGGCPGDRRSDNYLGSRRRLSDKWCYFPWGLHSVDRSFDGGSVSSAEVWKNNFPLNSSSQNQKLEDDSDDGSCSGDLRSESSPDSRPSPDESATKNHAHAVPGDHAPDHAGEDRGHAGGDHAPDAGDRGDAKGDHTSASPSTVSDPFGLLEGSVTNIKKLKNRNIWLADWEDESKRRQRVV